MNNCNNLIWRTVLIWASGLLSITAVPSPTRPSSIKWKVIMWKLLPWPNLNNTDFFSSFQFLISFILTRRFVTSNRPFSSGLEPLCLRVKLVIWKCQCSAYRFIFMQMTLIFIRKVCTETRFETEAQGKHLVSTQMAYCMVTPFTT